MLYIDVKQELDKIMCNLKQELLKAGAINSAEKLIDKNEFNRIIDEKIDKCNVIYAQIEASGKRFDANSANIIGANIDFLRTIKANESLNIVATNESDRENKIIEKFQNKKATNGFLGGMKKLFCKNPILGPSRSR